MTLLFLFSITEGSENSCLTFMLFVRSVVAESEDVIKAAVDGLINSGFINYYGLQVQETCPLISFAYASNFWHCPLTCITLFVSLFASVLVVLQYQIILLVLLCLEESGEMQLA
jgi:hypothetical protein